ncbi:peptidylprolyl isomerase [Marinicrinis lubricantis]|uniref:peptidylprolyl isomerase n=1 Tax=Marinicrinis lubricantis TaxID=2086470 RepID=A0ABW1IT65_9BACL
MSDEKRIDGEQPETLKENETENVNENVENTADNSQNETEVEPAAAEQEVTAEERSSLLDTPNEVSETESKKSAGNGLLIGTILVAAAAIIAVLLIVKPFGGDSEAAAEVNGVEISKDALLDKLMEQDQNGTLNRLIEDELIRQEAEQLDVEMTDEELNQELEFYKNTYSSELEFQYLLSMSGYTEASFKEALKEDLLATKVFEKQANITDEELQTTFEQYKASYSEPEMIRASHILVEDEQQANDLLKQINEGADFAKLAEEYSTDGSAPRGGNLDYFSREDMVQEFSDAAFQLKKGEVSGVVQTDYGYHIIKVTDVPKDWTYEEKKEEVYRIVLNQKLQAEGATWISGLKSDAEITNYFDESDETDAGTDTGAETGDTQNAG